MPYAQNIDSCFAETIGAGGLPRPDFEAALAETAAALDWLRAGYADRSLPFLRPPDLSADLGACPAMIAAWRGAGVKTVVVLGTGGSLLGGAAFAALAGTGPAALDTLFMDLVEPGVFEALFATCPMESLAFLAISKSGRTAETLAQFMIALEAAVAAGARPADRFCVIAEPGDNPLRAIAAHHAIPAIDHDPKLGGRFAVLSPVGMLPAMAAGLDVAAARAGARDLVGDMLEADSPADFAPAVGAALNVACARTLGTSQTVLWIYGDRLRALGDWHRQLWAESLGKDGHGTTPQVARGPSDQHSLMQLYLDGPRDKLFTMLVVDWRGAGERISADPDEALFAGAAPDPLGGRSLGELMEAQYRATAEALAGRGRPVRTLRVARLDETALGALMMHFMLETVIAARLIGVDPFDQPAVEAGKARAIELLAGMARDGTRDEAETS